MSGRVAKRLRRALRARGIDPKSYFFKQEYKLIKRRYVNPGAEGGY